MDLSYYDFNPGVLGLIIWGLISYFSRKKKKKDKSKREQIPIKEESYDLDYFENILEPEGIVNSASSISINESFQDVDVPLEIKEVTTPEKKLQSEEPLIKNFNNKKQANIEFLIMIKHKNSSKSAFIMKEILDQPLSLRNYE